MERLYFTFGSDPAYPYGRDAFVVAIGRDRNDCIEAFKKKHPNRPGSDAYNAADSYTAKEWDKVSEEHYKDTKLTELIVSDTVYGSKPEGFEPLWIFVPKKNAVVFIQEGSGDNLSEDDLEAGMKDYLDCTGYTLENGFVKESDGGDLMLSYMVQDFYSCLADAIPDVMEFLYEDMFMDAVILCSEAGNMPLCTKEKDNGIDFGGAYWDTGRFGDWARSSVFDNETKQNLHKQGLDHYEAKVSRTGSVTVWAFDAKEAKDIALTMTDGELESYGTVDGRCVTDAYKL